MAKFDPLTSEIPEADLAHLRTLAGLSDDYGQGDANDLPPELRVAYWERKRVHDRFSVGAMDDQDYKSIGVQAGLGRTLPGDDKPKTILDLFTAGEIHNGDPVIFNWRRQQVPGHFQGMSRDKKLCKVCAVDSSEVREVPVADVFSDFDREPAELTPASAKREEEKPAKNKGGRPRKNPEPVGATAGEREDIHAGQSHDDGV